MKQRHLKLLLALCLAVSLLTVGALAAEETGESVIVGNVELVGSADAPAYAVTDETGTVTPGGSEDNYNVKWDGTTLTLQDANIEEAYPYNTDTYTSMAGIYRAGDMEIALIGTNSVIIPAPEGMDSDGIHVAEGALTISGSGALEVLGSYDGIASSDDSLTITGGEVRATGGSGGISVYESDMTVTGGHVTAIADGNYIEPMGETTIACGIYVQGNFTLSGGLVSVRADSVSEYVTTAWGVYVYGSEHNVSISGGTLNASVEDGDAAALRCSGSVTISGGNVMVSNPAEDGDGILATTVTVTGGNLYAEAEFLPIQSSSDLTISGGVVTTNGYWALYSYRGDIVITGGTVMANGTACSVYARQGQVLVSPQEGWQLTVSAGSDAVSAGEISGSAFRAEAEISALVSETNYFRSMATKRVASVFVGDRELISTDGQIVYAVTDETGAVTPGGSEDNYNVKWDGTTLTLRDANITGANVYKVEDEDDPDICAAVLSCGAMELELIGQNTVTGPKTGSDLYSTGLAAMGGLVISGEGSIYATGCYDGLTVDSSLTVISGTIVAEGGSGGLTTYEGSLTISGGNITARTDGSYMVPEAVEDADYYEVSYAIYADWNCFITGGNITAKATGDAAYIPTVAGIFVSTDSSLIISGGNITASGASESGTGFGICTWEDVYIRGGTLTLSGTYDSIYAGNDLIITGGTMDMSILGSPERAYSVAAYNDIAIHGGTINAQGFYSYYGDVDITDGKVTSSGCGTGKGFFAYDGDINVSGGTVSVPYSHTALDGVDVNITGGTLTLAGSSAGIFAPENVNISGGTISAETANTENGCVHAYAGDINISGGTLSASGGASALSAPAGEINIVPASDRELAVSAGESAGSAVEITGSPFSEAAAIGELVEGQKYFRSADPIPFTDVSRSNWYYDAVKYVYTNGLMDGTAADTFAPGSTMTRRMVWAILARLDGEAITGANWTDDARAWAVDAGISDGEDPNGLVTRQQLIVMLYRFAGAPDVTGSLSAFADESSVSDWARDAMAWAVEAGLITGATLDPQGAATRSQAAAMLMRFADSIK